MSHQDGALPRRKSGSEQPFRYQNDQAGTHPTLLPNGILNDDEDEVVPWPRRASRTESTAQTSTLKVKRLPQDLTAREFAALFTFADGFQSSDLVNEAEERIGIAKFNTQTDADRAMQKMSSVSAGPYSKLAFEIVSKHEAQEVPSTLSSSSKSSGSNGSMPQMSRLASYVKEKNGDSQIGMNDFYGNGSSVPKSAGMPASIPTNYSTSASTTVWSPTSPRFDMDLSKSPPANLSMLPPPSREDESWARSNTNGMSSSRFAQLSINTGMASQDSRREPQQSPTIGVHPNSAPLYPSIDTSVHPGMPKTAYPSSASSQQMFHSSPPKHYMTGPGNNAPYNGYGQRMGHPTPINTNPADQNPPCNTLYVGNLPLATTEEELKSLFSRQPGYRRLCYRTKSNGPMCFVEFEDVHFAINSLKLLQGVVLSSSIKGGIRLSFSKNPLGVRKMDGSQLMSNHNGISNQSNGNSYNAMHAPPGLQSGHAPGQQQAPVNPIWR